MPVAPVGPYTPIVRAGPWLVTSGQLGAVDGTLVAGGFAAEFRQAAGIVGRILHGADPATLPVESPLRFELALNEATAKKLQTAAAAHAVVSGLCASPPTDLAQGVAAAATAYATIMAARADAARQGA